MGFDHEATYDTRCIRESLVSQYAHAYEHATHYRQPPPTVPLLALPV
jgi:hypothetical protein